jgi:membrane protein YdbS with pleckstrin-like domain
MKTPLAAAAGIAVLIVLAVAFVYLVYLEHWPRWLEYTMIALKAITGFLLLGCLIARTKEKGPRT